MKKILILTAVFAFAATNCFAIASGATGTMTTDTLASDTGKEVHAGTSTSAATATSALIGKNSTGVGVAWRTATGGYALVTQHKSGTKGYGTSYDSTAIYQFAGEKDPGTPALGVPTATDTTDFTTAKGWKAM